MKWKRINVYDVPSETVKKKVPASTGIAKIDKFKNYVLKSTS